MITHDQVQAAIIWGTEQADLLRKSMGDSPVELWPSPIHVTSYYMEGRIPDLSTSDQCNLNDIAQNSARRRWKEHLNESESVK